jgi:hypothetical protein
VSYMQSLPTANTKRRDVHRARKGSESVNRELPPPAPAVLPTRQVGKIGRRT